MAEEDEVRKASGRFYAALKPCGQRRCQHDEHGLGAWRAPRHQHLPP